MSRKKSELIEADDDDDDEKKTINDSTHNQKNKDRN